MGLVRPGTRVCDLRGCTWWLGSVSEILPTILRLQHAQVHGLPRGAVITTLITRARITRPHPLTRCLHITKQRPTQHSHPLRTTPRSSIHGGHFGLPPVPHLPFGSIPIRSIKQQPGDSDEASNPVTEIPFRFRPPLHVLDDQSVGPEATEDRGGVAGADTEQTRARIDGQGRVLGQEGVDLGVSSRNGINTTLELSAIADCNRVLRSGSG